MEPEFKLGIGTYKDASCRILYFGHVPLEEANVDIGNFSSIAAECEFFIDGNHHFDHASSFPFYELGYCKTNRKNKNGYGKGSPVIGHDVWIGRGAMIMSGVRIGNGCVIGARTVVTKDCPPYSVVVGNPGKIIKYRFSSDIIERFQHVQWWNFSLDSIVRRLAPLQYDVMKFLNEAETIQQELQCPPSYLTRFYTWICSQLK